MYVISGQDYKTGPVSELNYVSVVFMFVCLEVVELDAVKVSTLSPDLKIGEVMYLNKTMEVWFSWL